MVDSVIPERHDDAVDLRGRQRPPWELVYAPGGVVCLAGLPGAGKTTLLRRVFAEPDAHDHFEVLDSDEVRRRFHRRLGVLPYAGWRPLVHLVHYLRIVRAAHGPADRTILIHDTGTHTWLRRGVLHVARWTGRPVHALLLDVDPTRAWTGQLTRDRQVSPRRFTRHRAGWRRLVDAVTDDPAGAEGYASCVLFDRAAATRLRAIVHHEPVAEARGVGQRLSGGGDRGW